MRHYTKILIWENKRRLNKLFEFRQLIFTYLNNSRVEWITDTRIEEVTAHEARVKINRAMREISSMIFQSGIVPTLHWIPPATVRGHAVKVNLIDNIFRLDELFIDPRHVLDVIDNSIGIYESNVKWARIKIFNPFFYIGLMFDFISRLPFIALGKLGADQQRMEMSVFGRLIKGVLYLIQIAAALIGIYQFWDFWTPVKNFVRELGRP